MIWESSYWKDELLRIARALEAKKKQKRWMPSSFGNLEKSIMIGFYCIRRLMESQKLSDSISGQSLIVGTYRNNGKLVNLLNWDMVGLHYDLDTELQCTRDLKWVCNQMIHSYVFVPSFEETEVEERFSGIFFSSDRERNKTLYHLDIDKIISLFKAIGSNYPASGQFVHEATKNDYYAIQE